MTTRSPTLARPPASRLPISRSAAKPGGPCTTPRSNRHADLPEVRTRRLVPERIRELREFERAVDHRLDARHFERADHIALVLPAADDQALQPLLPRHQRRGR